MKSKLIAIGCVFILLVSGLLVYLYGGNIHLQQSGSVGCNQDQTGIEVYANQVLAESVSYKIQEGLIEQSIIDEDRSIFVDKNGDMVLIQDRYSGRTGFRIVSVILKDERVVKIIDVLEKPAIGFTSSNNEFYVSDGKICGWYQQDQLMNLNLSEENEYLSVIERIISDAEEVAKDTE